MYTIKQADLNYLDQILQFDPLVGTLPGRKELHEHALASGYTYIALEGEVLVGFIILTYQLFGNGFIELLRVSPEFRGKGYGTKLIAYAEKICKTKKLFVSTNTANKVMNPLLKKLGYIPCGHLECINDEPWDHELFYVKMI